jgi:hypothetical protein
MHNHAGVLFVTMVQSTEKQAEKQKAVPSLTDTAC